MEEERKERITINIYGDSWYGIKEIKMKKKFEVMILL